MSEDRLQPLALDSPFQGEQVLRDDVSDRGPVLRRKDLGEGDQILVKTEVQTRFRHNVLQALCSYHTHDGNICQLRGSPAGSAGFQPARGT